MERIYLILADALLILHTAIVLFIVAGFLLVWVGYFRHWPFVRNFAFRMTHLLAMGYVAVQTVLGADCPLTTWENALRVKGGTVAAYGETFVGHWLAKILFYDVGLGTFALVYTLLFLLIVITWLWIKPNPPRKPKPAETTRDQPAA